MKQIEHNQLVKLFENKGLAVVFMCIMHNVFNTMIKCLSGHTQIYENIYLSLYVSFLKFISIGLNKFIDIKKQELDN